MKNIFAQSATAKKRILMIIFRDGSKRGQMEKIVKCGMICGLPGDYPKHAVVTIAAIRGKLNPVHNIGD